MVGCLSSLRVFYSHGQPDEMCSMMSRFDRFYRALLSGVTSRGAGLAASLFSFSGVRLGMTCRPKLRKLGSHRRASSGGERDIAIRRGGMMDVTKAVLRGKKKITFCSRSLHEKELIFVQGAHAFFHWFSEERTALRSTEPYSYHQRGVPAISA